MDVERKLSVVLSEFAHTLVTDFPIQAILDHLVLRIVDVLPISAAGVTLIAPSVKPRYIAASDDAALRFEQLQTELREGPCLEVYASGKAVAIANLEDDDRFPRFSPRALDEGMAAVFTFPLRQGDSRLGALDLYRSTPGPLSPEDTVTAQTLADVTAAYLINAQARDDLRAASEQARHTSVHDALTGLPNRSLLVERLDHAILRCRRSEKMLAILYADLDHFKVVNDTYGHHVGDELLTAVAHRLTRVLRPGDTLARIGGDEFVVLCEDLDDAAQVDAIAERIADALTDSFTLTEAEIRITASVGVAFAGLGEDIPERILQDADAAMYNAKRAGGGRHSVTKLADEGLARHRAGLNRDLSGALERGELRTAYQPIVATADGRVVGAEALVRWAHPLHGEVSPVAMIPLAEHAGLISEIGRWVLERACLDRQTWVAGNGAPPLIAVNVSAHQLMTGGFVRTVADVLDLTETDPGLVTLEVTESVFLQDSERALVVLQQLKRVGVSLALDDFGTGYSSLSYLRQFPVDIVKIDQTFIADLTADPTSQLIVGAVVGLAHGLGSVIVAEGVETAEQHALVAELDCDFCQGFYFAKPMRAIDAAVAVSAGVLPVPRVSA